MLIIANWVTGFLFILKALEVALMKSTKCAIFICVHAFVELTIGLDVKIMRIVSLERLKLV